MRQTWSQWVSRCVVLCVAALCVTKGYAQSSQSGALPAFTTIACMPGGASGVQYVTSANRPVTCGTDANGVTLYAYLNTTLVAVPPSANEPVSGGEQIGLDIGGAVLLVFATAHGIRTLRNFINSSSEG